MSNRGSSFLTRGKPKKVSATREDLRIKSPDNIERVVKRVASGRCHRCRFHSCYCDDDDGKESS